MPRIVIWSFVSALAVASGWLFFHQPGRNTPHESAPGEPAATPQPAPAPAAPTPAAEIPGPSLTFPSLPSAAPVAPISEKSDEALAFEALRAALAQPDSARRNESVAKALAALDGLGGTTVLPLLRDFSDEGVHAAIDNHLVAWAAHEPSEAWNWLHSLQPTDPWLGRAHDLVQRLAENDPTNAWERIHSIPSSELRESAQSAALRAVVVNDSSRAPVYLDSITDQGQRANILYSVQRNWLENDAQGFLSYAQRIEDPEMKRELLASSVGIILARDQVEGLQLLASMPGNVNRTQLLTEGVARWGGEDPDPARAFASTYPEPMTRERLVRAIEDKIKSQMDLMAKSRE